MDSFIMPLAGLIPSGAEWLIILLIAILLFGGSRLAGIGKSSGRAIREFKEETRGIKEDEKRAKEKKQQEKSGKPDPELEASSNDEAVDAEIVEPSHENSTEDPR